MRAIEDWHEDRIAMKTEIAMDATDLTHLSSREQLSALMDGALPADETRFLLRRLRHDASLAECWERWRLSAEVMRGLAPAQRLPADFALRVAASLRGEAHDTGRPPARPQHAWSRWGGGAALAASLAVMVFATQPTGLESSGNRADSQVAAVTGTAPSLANDAIALSNAPASKAPEPQAPARDPAGVSIESQTAALATAVAAVARPARTNGSGSQARATQAGSMWTARNDAQSLEVGIAAASTIQPLLPQADITTRPWPRSVLPHDGNPGITVGFGDTVRSTAPYNPFQVRSTIGNLPTSLIADPAGGDSTPPDRNETGRAANSEPQS